MFILKIFFFFILLILIFYFQKNVRILYFLDFLLLAPSPVLTGGFLLRLETKEPQTTGYILLAIGLVGTRGKKKRIKDNSLYVLFQQLKL